MLSHVAYQMQAYVVIYIPVKYTKHVFSLTLPAVSSVSSFRGLGSHGNSLPSGSPPTAARPLNVILLSSSSKSASVGIPVRIIRMRNWKSAKGYVLGHCCKCIAIGLFHIHKVLFCVIDKA